MMITFLNSDRSLFNMLSVHQPESKTLTW